MSPSKNSAFAVVVCLVALVHFPLGVRATSTGALERSCASMIPEHGVAAQSVPSPYAIRVSTTAAKAGDTLKVMIAGLTAADTFKGFLLQARVADGRNGTEAVGEFVVDAAVKSVKTLKCGASPKVSLRPPIVANVYDINVFVCTHTECRHPCDRCPVAADADLHVGGAVRAVRTGAVRCNGGARMERVLGWREV